MPSGAEHKQIVKAGAAAFAPRAGRMAGMEPNPYESPAIPGNNRSSTETDNAVNLLSEMRDMQREMLEISRRNSAINKFAVIFAVSLLGVLMISLAGVIALRFILPNF